MSYKNILALVSGWFIILVLITYFGASVFPSIKRPENIYLPPNNIYWERWSNWDGAHFLSIAQTGYQFYEVVFFPLYPILIKFLFYFTQNYFWSAYLISIISIFTGLYFFYKLILLDFTQEIAEKSIFLLLIFPTSFFFLATYTESLFFLLTIASFYYARTNNFLFAFILAGLSSITRVFGIFTVIGIIFEYFNQNRDKVVLRKIFASKQFRFIIYLIFVDLFLFLSSSTNLILTYMFYYLLSFTILFFITYIIFLYLVNPGFKKFIVSGGWQIIFSITPVLLYCLYLLYTQNSAIAFIRYEANWGRQLSLPWQTLLNNLHSSNTFYSFIELLFAIIFIIGFIFSLLKLRFSYTLFFGLSLILPLLTSTLLSIHRFGLLFFPLFILLAQLKNNTLLYLWIIFSTIFLGIFSIMYILNYWVA